jgi:hypothetical protein
LPNINRVRYYGVRIAFSVLVGAGALLLIAPLTLRVLRPAILEYGLAHLSDRDRQQLYERIMSRSQGLFDAVPEPLVARLGKPNFTIVDYETRVSTNNAGMRSARRYGPKEGKAFRIACLGDSFVFGTGGLEEDRFCDQMGRFYADHHVQIGGRSIETYALGLGGWNALQEAAYLSSRITGYDPDVIVMLTVENDLMDSYGVTGSGAMTSTFTPQHRDRGSAVFTSQAGADFGEWESTALNSGLGPEAQARWGEMMAAVQRLTDLQHRRGKQMLHSVLRYSDDHFAELYKHAFTERNIQAPMMVTSFFYGPKTRLPHDSHPNRYGHSILASHYIHKLSALGWIPVPSPELPELHEGLSLDQPAPDPSLLRTYRQRFAAAHLRTSLDFTQLGPGDVKAFLGGIFPERPGPESLKEAPWGTVRSGFLLRRPSGAQTVDVRIRVSPIVELFPLEIRMSVDAAPPKVFRFEHPNESGVYDLVAEVPSRVSPQEEPAVEVMLETDSYFTWIEDHRMKSYRLLLARAR